MFTYIYICLICDTFHRTSMNRVIMYVQCSYLLLLCTMCRFTVLDRKRFGMSMSFVVINVCMCGGEGEKKEAVGDRQRD
jgi:hypothetical protein